MDIFEIQNERAIPTTHALLIEPFKTIWESDTSKDKSEAIKKFTFIELMCSRKKTNPFIGYSESERYSKIAENIYGDNMARPTNDELVDKGLTVYRQLMYEASPTLSYLEAALEAAEKVKDMMKNVDFEERTNGGAAVYKPGDITRALKETNEVVKSLLALKEKVENEMMEDAKTRGSRDIGHFER